MKIWIATVALALMLTGCSAVIQVTDQVPVRISICNTTVCPLWHVREHHWHRWDDR